MPFFDGTVMGGDLPGAGRSTLLSTAHGNGARLWLGQFACLAFKAEGGLESPKRMTKEQRFPTKVAFFPGCSACMADFWV